MIRRFWPCFAPCLLLFGLSLVTSCQEKTEVTQELEEKRAVLAEKKAELSELKAKYASTPAAGHGAIPQPNEVYGLQTQLKSLEGEIQTLQGRKTEVEAANASAKQKVQDYLAKHSNS